LPISDARWAGKVERVEAELESLCSSLARSDMAIAGHRERGTWTFS
jgi:hypothetical protein